MPSYQFKQEASIEARNEQGMDGRGGVWGQIIRVLTYYWYNEVEWYPGSVLSKVIIVFRDVSLYTAAILLAVYMIL